MTRIAQGHAWNVWPDPEPETVAGLMERLRRLAAETHGEVCMSRVIAAVDLVEEALPAIRAEATAAALAALRERVEGLPGVGVPTAGRSAFVSRAAVLSLLAAPLSVREAGLDVERLAAALHEYEHSDHLASTGCRTGHRAKARALAARLAATPERPAEESRNPKS